MDNIKHLVRIGELQEEIEIYLEDYVYTYLKKAEEEGEIHKLYLFGEKQLAEDTERLYVYGMSELRQDAKTFFGEYELLGTLQLKEEERYFIPPHMAHAAHTSHSGHASSVFSEKEIRMEGFFVFYADNKAMQEFLISRHRNKKQEDKPASEDNRKITRIKFNAPSVPDREAYAFEDKKRQKDTVTGSLLLVCFTGVVCFLAAGIFSKNPLTLRDMIPGIVSSQEEISEGDSLIVEEIGYAGTGDASGEDTLEAIAAIEPQGTETADEIAPEPEEEVIAETTAEEEPDTETTAEEEPDTESAAEEEAGTEATTGETETEPAEVTYTEYTVQEGDTLANICLVQYGSLEKMQEICDYNEISNADHIAPGEKIYLPD